MITVEPSSDERREQWNNGINEGLSGRDSQRHEPFCNSVTMAVSGQCRIHALNYEQDIRATTTGRLSIWREGMPDRPVRRQGLKNALGGQGG